MDSSSSHAIAHVHHTSIISGDLGSTYRAARGARIGNLEPQEKRRLPSARSRWIEMQPSIARDFTISKDTWEYDSDGHDTSEAIR